MLISNSSYMHFANSSKKIFVIINIISSTYICTIKIPLPFLFVKRVVSILSQFKSCSIRKDFNIYIYQALGACFKPYKAFFSLKTWSGMSHVCGVAVISSTLICNLSGKYRETRNSCFLSVESGNESRHLVFWSLETLTGLRDRARGLVAYRKCINTPNTLYLR